MCFSATASFGIGAVLGVIGTVAVTKAKTNRVKLFAGIPLIFAVQQLSEGLLWLSLKDARLAEWQHLLTYIYLVFAMAVWPFWIPFTVRLLEKDVKRKKIITALLATGTCVTICVILVLSIYPIMVMPMKHHLHYEFDFPSTVKALIIPFTVLYIAATVATPFVSTIKIMKWLGASFLASYIFAVVFYNGFVLSVWCFFAALLSFIVLLIILKLQKSDR
jgi:uncharacterized protein DUF6629